MDKRVESIDILRGLVIALMIVDHVREYFFLGIPLSDPMNINTTPFMIFFDRFLAHFCAPTFIFLAGVSAYLYEQKRDKKQLSIFLFKRGLFLMLLEIFVINFAWPFPLPPSMIYLQVIWVIGFSMMCLSVIIWFPRYVTILISLFLVAGQHFFSGVTFDLELGKYIWSLLYDRNVLELTSNISVRTSYPILPWIGVISLGYLYGYIFTNQIDTSKRNKILAISSVLCFSIFIIFRFFNIYGETIPFILNSNDFVVTIMSFFNVTKYPPSFLFVMITLSGSFFCLRYIDKLYSSIKKILLNFGRVPLFYYILHLYILRITHTIVTYLFVEPNYHANNKSAIFIWLISLIVLTFSYPIVLWLVKVKSNSKNKLLSYL